MNPHFVSLVMGLTAQASSALEGALPPGVPTEGVSPRDLARTMIDTLAMLQEKTEGRLEPEEARLLADALTGLRFRFVQPGQAGA